MVMEMQSPPDAPPLAPPVAQALAPAAAGPSYDQLHAAAQAHARAGQLDLALREYSTLLARAPNDPDLLLGRAQVYSRQERWAEAERDLRAAAQTAPKYADLWAALGNVARWSGRPLEAIGPYREALRLQPSDHETRLGLVQALRAAGQRAEAERMLDDAQRQGAPADRIAALRAAAGTQPTPAAGTPHAPSTSSVAAPVPVQASSTASPAVSAHPAPVPATDQAIAPGGPAERSLPSGFQWAASLSAGATRLSPSGQRWNDQALAIRRYWNRGSLAAEAMRVHRLGRHDHAWALDGYINLWRGAYANLRYQKAPLARLFPDNAWRAELFQPVGSGWELAASEDALNFPATRVRIHGLALGKYSGNFYIRLRHTIVSSPGARGTGDRLLVRWYDRGDADNYLEASANRGRSDDMLSLVGGRSHSGGAAFNVVRYLTPAWGMRAGLSYSRETGGGRERALSAALYRRW